MIASRSMAVRRGLVIGVTLFVSASVDGARPAAQNQQTAATQPTFRTEANYVRVDAYPMRNGAPVADLTRDDFEILEDGKPQQLDQFERVLVRANVPQDLRAEPNTVAESRAMAEGGRARLFVLFLDTYHVDAAASHDIRKPLTDALDHLLGADDLLAVMTPEMSPSDMTFARRTTTVSGFLERYWPWGERDRENPIDEVDRQYGQCYPNVPPVDLCKDQNGIAAEMIDRRREQRTLDALDNLVKYLRGVREERKAILTISNGWRLFRPNPALMRPLTCEPAAAAPVVRVDPRGRPTTKSPAGEAAMSSCAVDRINLAQIDDERAFNDILGDANRANASFYPVDPRGLVSFDTSLMRMDVPGVAPPPVSPGDDRERLVARGSSLRTLAEGTDGLSLVQSNNLAGGFRRIMDDLSAYYLLGYYSSGKLDGKFHTITVRVKRPGVQVRARRGYLAAGAAEVARTARTAARDTPPTPAEAEAAAMERVLRPLSTFTREASLRLRAAAGWTSDGHSRVWVVGELGTASTWALGAEADVVLSKNGETLATTHATVPPGTRTFRVSLAPESTLAAGDYSVDVRTKATSLLATSSDLIPLPVPAAPEIYGSLLVRRGPYTGVKEIPTADLRFRRSEQLRVEVPVGSTAASATARLLDRNGKAIPVPIAATVRDDADGSRWAAAPVPLFPLGPGEYVVEIRVGELRMLTPFRVVP